LFIAPNPEHIPTEPSDHIEIHERAKTGLVRGTPHTWVEIVIRTETSGDIAIFAPSTQEIALGEADLAIEHLRRSAASFADRVRDVRNAFRMARHGRAISSIWTPLTRRVHLEGHLSVMKPSLDRMVLVLGLGAMIGMISTAVTGISTVLIPLSIGVMGYALSGLAILTRADRDIEEVVSLSVPITTASPPTSIDIAGMTFEGPYTVHPQISVTAGPEGLDLVPIVQILDASGSTVRVFSPSDLGDIYTVEDAAISLMRDADAFVEELRYSESGVRRMTEGEL
jgi:hypothetical protein